MPENFQCDLQAIEKVRKLSPARRAWTPDGRNACQALIERALDCWPITIQRCQKAESAVAKVQQIAPTIIGLLEEYFTIIDPQTLMHTKNCGPCRVARSIAAFKDAIDFDQTAGRK